MCAHFAAMPPSLPLPRASPLPIAAADVGETNTTASANFSYDCAFRARITSWRAHFLQPALPFVFALLAPWAVGGGGNTAALPPTRLAQLNATTLPAVGMAAAYDLGDALSPWPGHPRDKQDVGVRMAASLLAIAYGQAAVVHTGPQYASMAATGTGAALRVAVSFKAGTTADCGTGVALRLNTSVACPTPTIPAQDCEGFAVRTSDGVWRAIPPAGVSLSADGSQLVLAVAAAPAGATAVGTRGMHADWPLAMLHNGCGFPVEPWRVEV